MPPLYKYLPGKYVDAFTRRGEVLFRSLSYFRSYEEQQVRGDKHEGVSLYRPKAGLELTNVHTGQKHFLAGSFESTVRDREIFISCLSRRFSRRLAREFNATACVEICQPFEFLMRIRAALRRCRSHTACVPKNGRVRYYTPETVPLARWAVPEQIVMQKLNPYRRQAEYRIAFATNGAFRVYDVATRLVLSAPPEVSLPTNHPQVVLELGGLADICKVHWLR